MGHGKETPRQKMIGMMYLVLLALLALNVSKDVLDAFVIVEEGLYNTNKNFEEKNKEIYDELETKLVANEDKVRPWFNKAMEVKKHSNQLFDYMHESKIKILEAGNESEALEGPDDDHDGKQVDEEEGHIYVDLIQGKDNTSVPAEVMMFRGRGAELRQIIDDYREFLLDMLDNKEDMPALVETIKEGLSTDPQKYHGETVPWESYYFENLPLIGVMTNLSLIQNNVRNIESEMLKYLTGQIDAGAFKVNQLEAVVIPNSNYIIRGNDYRADIFIAARDTTNDPVVLIGEYDSSFTEEGNVEYEMVGTPDTLKVERGKGKLTRPAQSLSLGDHTYEGLILLRKEDGGYIKKPFKQTFQVAEGSVVVSPTKMNVFYVGVDNPVDISVAGVPADKIEARVTNGSIRGRGPYIVNPRRPGNSIVRVFAEIEGERKQMGTKEFRVKTVPDPVAQVNGQEGGAIRKEVLLVQTGVAAVMKDFDFDLKFTVTEFTVSTTTKGFLREATSKSNRFTDEQKTIFSSMNKGQTVYIQDIKAVGPSGAPRKLSTLNFRVQ